MNKYDYTENELLLMDKKIWDFTNLFNFCTYGVTSYRKCIINLINDNINEDDFYEYEILLEKMLWNLKEKTKYLFSHCCDNIIIKELSYTNKKIYKNKMNEILSCYSQDNAYRSFINKLILVDDINKKLYYKKMEGNNYIFTKNEFNIKTWIPFKSNNCTLYDSIMNDPKKITFIDIPKYYYSYDYPFPNLNFGKPFIYSEKFRKYRINQLYYSDNCEENWFKLLNPPIY